MTLFSTPSRLYRVLALAEMVTWALLLTGMFVKYVLEASELLVRIGGGLHGFTFLSYAVVTVLVAVDQRWKFSHLLMGLGSAIIPFLTVPFERFAMHRGLLGDQWRLRQEASLTEPSLTEPDGAKGTRTVPEKVVALALRYPLPSALIAIVVVAIVFFVLLMLGPPTEWFS